MFEFRHALFQRVVLGLPSLVLGLACLVLGLARVVFCCEFLHCLNGEEWQPAVVDGLVAIAVGGDKFRQDAEGYWYYEGRGDDLIKSGGIYVSPLEVENCLMQHDAVRECCVVPKKDASGLEKPLAIVVLKERVPATEADLIAFAKTKLARYKAPHWVTFVATPLPRNDRDKIDRKKLRAEHG